jgi:CRP-like cAMP-binding protein
MAIIRKEAKVASFLKEVNLFEGLEKKVINDIFKLGLVQNFKTGDLIIREGQPGGNLHILIAGKAEVLKAVKGKKNGKRLSTLDRGSVFGEMSIFDGAPSSATIRAIAECDIHIIRGSDFDQYLKTNPKVAYEVLRTLICSISNRLRRANLAISLTSKG